MAYVDIVIFALWNIKCWLWPLTLSGRSDEEVAVDTFACLSMYNGYTYFYHLKWFQHSPLTFDLFMVGQTVHRGHRGYLWAQTFTFVIWNSFKFWPLTSWWKVGRRNHRPLLDIFSYPDLVGVLRKLHMLRILTATSLGTIGTNLLIC